jgi:hypothetical protein
MKYLLALLTRFSVRAMNSKARTQDKFLSPAPEMEVLISEATKPKRQSTVYDAVAGETSSSKPHICAHIV